MRAATLAKLPTKTDEISWEQNLLIFWGFILHPPQIIHCAIITPDEEYFI